MRADPPIVNVTTAAPEVHLDMDEFKPPDLPSAAQHDVRYLEQFIQDPMDGRLPEVNVDWQPPDGLQAMGIDDESWQPDPMDTETGI
jgi:hypothetical protein